MQITSVRISTNSMCERSDNVIETWLSNGTQLPLSSSSLEINLFLNLSLDYSQHNICPTTFLVFQLDASGELGSYLAYSRI